MSDITDINIPTYGHLFKDFTAREEDLESIIRYKNYPEKLYPTTLNSHQHQVAAMVKKVGIYMLNIGVDFDLVKAIVMAYIHDDHEPFMELGDVQSASEFHRTEKEIERIEKDEALGICLAANAYPEYIHYYRYEELLLEAAFSINTIESQFVKLMDKVVGLCEALHEVQSGNKTFLEQKTDILLGKLNPTPFMYYTDYFSSIEKKLPLLKTWFDASHELSFLYKPLPEKLACLSNHYKLWEDALIKYAPPWERERLGMNL